MKENGTLRKMKPNPILETRPQCQENSKENWDSDTDAGSLQRIADGDAKAVQLRVSKQVLRGVLATEIGKGTAVSQPGVMGEAEAPG
jgi:hypothetical protein